MGLASMLGIGLTAGSDRAQASAVTAVDCHAHIFKRGLKLASTRRYAPDYDATLDDYLRQLDANGMSHGVLIQPSFLGTDNSYLLEGLKAAKGRLRGIAVVEPTSTAEELRTLGEAGISGIRLNLVGQPIPAFEAEPWPSFLRRVADLNWQIEVQRAAKDWGSILPPLLSAGVSIVIDHFGLPDATLGVEDPGFKLLLASGQERRIWVKLSGFYRIASSPQGEATAVAAYPLLRDALGLDRLVWGSDWPHTQFESQAAYDKARRFLDVLVPDAGERRQILGRNAAELFRFIA